MRCRRQAVTPHGFAERFDDRLRARLALARRLGHRLAPPFQPDARQHRLAGHAAGARQLVIERQNANKSAARGSGANSAREEAVAVGAAHRVEHVAVGASGAR